eukprot:TRINITY_DN5255_c0_g1_i1.p1 TRINITY_DN5255_c0_g1~~TRINITY_DN5255_c0_g1_i1.p1  ORF type:complete len:578 (+),score=122.75 TRINITY_DN5255_c0_g1_i1:215-1948(+)
MRLLTSTMSPVSQGIACRTFYAFIVEVYDKSNSHVRRYRLNLYPGDRLDPPEIEMFDAEYGKTFVRRGRYNGLRLDQLHMGARVRIYDRETRVVGYADEWTRDQLAVSALACHRSDERTRTICEVPRKLQPYCPPGSRVNNQSPQKTEGSDLMLKSLLSELGEDFFSDEMKTDPESRQTEARQKYLELKDCVYWGKLERVPRLLRNGASMYTEDDNFTKKTLFHIAAERDQGEAIRKLHANRSSKLPDPVHAVDHLKSTPLHYAAVKGHTEPLKILVELGADVMHCDEYHMTPLHKAAKNGHSGAVRVLAQIGSGLNPLDRFGQTPLHVAACVGHTAVIKVLAEVSADLEVGDKDGSTPLHLAADRGQAEVAELLVELGAEIAACNLGGAKPVHVAATNGQLAVLRVLTKLKADVNSVDMYSETPLHRAASLGKNSVVEYLAELKADIDARDKYGESPMHRAAAMGQESTIRVLNLLGATPEPLDDDERTPLHVAAANWRRHAITELTDHGCTLLSVDKYKETPLHRAAAMGARDSMHHMTEMGAQISATNEYGETGLERLARRENQQQFMQGHDGD